MPALPPVLQQFITQITPSLNLLIINTVWAAALVPLLIILFFFSTPNTRKTPIFIMNVFSVTMGIILGAINLDLYVGAILHPGGDFPGHTLLAYIGMIIIMPIYMDCILAFRLYVVYPPRTTRRSLVALIFIPVCLLKIARIINFSLFMAAFSKAVLEPGTSSSITSFQALWDHAPYTRIEWVLQVVDNCYASGFFLWRIWLTQRQSKASGIVDSRSSARRSRGGRLMMLFYFALSSFVFPCLLSIAQTIIAFRIHDFFLGAYIFISNLYVDIIGVLLATIWTVKTHYDGETENRGAKSSAQFSTMSFRVGTTNSNSKGITVNTETLNDGLRTHDGSWDTNHKDVELKPFHAV